MIMSCKWIHVHFSTAHLTDELARQRFDNHLDHVTVNAQHVFAE